MAGEAEKKEKPLWNSLEITKIFLAILTPITILLLTFQLNKSQSAERETREAAVRSEIQERARVTEVTKQRVKLWSDISPLMNDLYCYYLYVGHWKEISPEQVLAKKRQLDKLVYSNRPFFSENFISKYNDFMFSAFNTRNGWGEDAKLKTSPIRDKDKGKEKMFYFDQGKNLYIDNTTEIHNKYFDLLNFAAEEMDLKIAKPPKPHTPDKEEVDNRLSENSKNNK